MNGKKLIVWCVYMAKLYNVHIDYVEKSSKELNRDMKVLGHVHSRNW